MNPPAAEVAPLSTRHHDLDALRAFAMLLGVGLHTAYLDIPFQLAGTGGSITNLEIFFTYVHGFRMPLFFLLSGYFTMLLFRRRGLRSLMIHRLRRVGLPLLISIFTILPLGIAGIIIGHMIAGVDMSYLDNAADGQSRMYLGHLWFLWFLLWLYAGFAVAARSGSFVRSVIADHRGGERSSARIRKEYLWACVGAALIPQLFMTETVFGPDTPYALLPAWHLLGFYACFFAFGVLIHDLTDADGAPLINTIGRYWAPLLGISTLLVFPPALWLALTEGPTIISALLQVIFAWTVSIGFIGLFHRYLSEPRFAVRWWSDASYWMYLMHVPLIWVLQGVATRLDLPRPVSFVAICLIVTGLLAASYRWLVRYTVVGSFLNGPRCPTTDNSQRAALKNRKLATNSHSQSQPSTGPSKMTPC